MHLEKNKCIDSNFFRRTSVLTIPSIVETSCGRAAHPLDAQLKKDIEASDLQLQQKNNEILTLQETVNMLRKDKATCEQVKVQQAEQNNVEIAECRRNLESKIAEITTLQSARASTELMNETFVFMRSQMEMKDRSILESSVKLSQMTEQIAQKNIAINYLQQKNAMLEQCQENS